MALALCTYLIAPSVAAQPRPDAGGASASRPEMEEAQKRYKRGIELFNEGQYDASMIELRKAYEIAPSYKILYNIAQVNRQLNDYARAVEFFERYLREGGSNIPAARAGEVQRELEKLRGRVSKVEVASNVAGAEVSVDDLTVGRTPFAQPLLVNAGRRKLVASVEGRAPVTRVIEVAGAEAVRVQLDFVEPAEPSRAASAGGPPPPAAGPRAEADVTAPAAGEGAAGPVPWLAWVATGALAVGAGVSGVLALQAKGRFQDERDTFGATPSQLDARNDRARTLGIVTDALLGATAVAGGVSLYLTLTARPRGAPATAGAVRLTLAPGAARLVATF